MIGQPKGAAVENALCPDCTAPLDIQTGEVACICPKCGQGFHLSAGDWRPVDVGFLIGEPGPSAKRLRPFWFFLTEMPLALSIAWGADPTRHSFGIYVPAYDLSRQEALAAGLWLTRWQPQYQPGQKGELRGCVMTQQEALHMADLIYVTLLSQMIPEGRTINDERPALLSTKILAIYLSDEGGGSGT